MSTTKKIEPASHVVLTSHPGQMRKGITPIHWGARTPMERGPVIASLTRPEHRNAIGPHSGSYSLYRALAMSAGQLLPDHRPDLTNTAPVEPIGPFGSWSNPQSIVSVDPWGA